MVQTLNPLKLDRGVPKVLFCDNGSGVHLTGNGSVGLPKWCEDGLLAAPGKPTDNPYVGILHLFGQVREESLWKLLEAGA